MPDRRKGIVALEFGVQNVVATGQNINVLGLTEAPESRDPADDRAVHEHQELARQPGETPTVGQDQGGNSENHRCHLSPPPPDHRTQTLIIAEDLHRTAPNTEVQGLSRFKN